ncbi:MAG TPA: ISKra4 family transposase, partial [Ktedonosporobacter sp.]|nr:ISKra4 family transposase [Ktedonosporobacter sp.]
IAESGNKLVVQARLKGAGMHWDRQKVNAMLALRTTLCSGRWTQDWQVVRDHWRTARRERFRVRSQAAVARASARLQHTFWHFPLSFILAVFPPPPPAPPVAKGRTEGQRRWGRQTFSQRAIQDGRFAKK